MKTIDVEIEGISPLLMHNIGSMAFESIGSTSKKITTKPSIEDEAEDSAYRKADGELYIPSRCVKAMLVIASTWYKVGKRSAKQFLGGGTRIEPYEIGLGTKKYEIDRRPVVIQGRNRIIRSRARLDKWKIKFSIIYNEDVFPNTDLIKTILEEAGMRVGLLDNRPQKGGENGTFKVINWFPKK